MLQNVYIDIKRKYLKIFSLQCFWLQPFERSNLRVSKFYTLDLQHADLQPSWIIAAASQISRTAIASVVSAAYVQSGKWKHSSNKCQERRGEIGLWFFPFPRLQQRESHSLTWSKTTCRLDCFVSLMEQCCLWFSVRKLRQEIIFNA